MGGSTETYSYGDGDKLQSVSVGGTAVKTYGYDAAGRTTSVVSSSGTTTLSYDAEGRAVSISGPGISQTNSYNGLDTRVSSVTNSVTNTFLRDGAYVTDPVVKDTNATYTPGISERRAGTTKQFSHSLKSVDSQTTKGWAARQVEAQPKLSSAKSSSLTSPCFLGLMKGNMRTSLTCSVPEMSMARRSKPIPHPPAGGMPHSRA